MRSEEREMRSEKSAISNYLSRLNRESRSAFNYSLLIANYSFPQGRLNPPIRGSIGMTFNDTL